MEKKEQVQVEDKIKTLFENKSLSRRIEFIQDYDFDKDKNHYEYFKSFILNFEITKDDWYNSLVINLADSLNIVSNELYQKYLHYLISNKYYLFRLSILDYFANNFEFYKKVYKIYDFESIKNDKKNRFIIRNQIIINNLIFFPKDKNIYIDELFKNYIKTNDYRSHIRLFNYIMNFELNKIISKNELNNLIKITESKNFGRAIALKLIEFKEYLK